ncbi:FirrV-1-A21 [Feldmannia irregularis virus a]|uniref:FirrV-1-A21 n=1 Tax=Feldmannia irregularis virus a TaxID=231992 RepID=Q6XM66_9PHYC|nr:FirrV-1-A21 [Feldmannia irregularis virus a]AAR26845.1 FirrV-1-A21 [Feldmannia irregularis virus a]
MASSALIEAKTLSALKLYELLIDPLYDVFCMQYRQIANRTETTNSLVYHIRNSMSGIRQWNALTIRDFFNNLVVQFPQLDLEFTKQFVHLQELTCNILNSSSASLVHTPSVSDRNSFLHATLSGASNALLDHREWVTEEDNGNM